MITARDVLDAPTWDLLDGHVVASECIEALAAIPDATVDSVVCDPPYGIGFMGHDWDQPGDQHGPVRSMGTPAPFASGKSLREPHVVGGRAQVPVGQRRAVHPKPSGFTKKLGARATDRDRGGAMEAGRYDLSLTANQRYQAWCEAWAAECFRVLKPGGHLLASCGTRTYHRLACGVEDAGFEVRDRILAIGADVPMDPELAWLYGSGFPKSLDVSKAIDKAAGVEGDWRQEDHPGRPGARERDDSNIGQTNHATEENPEGLRHVYVPATAEAQEWAGFGTALKPAHEPIVMARKPPIGTVAANVLAYGTGALNIEACRIKFKSGLDEAQTKQKNRHADFGSGARENQVYGSDERDRGEYGNYDAPGRWPPNVVVTHTAECAMVGTTEVDSDGHFPADRGASGYGANEFYGSNGGGLHGQEDLDERHMAGEVVEVWDCAPGCPVAALDAQSGLSKAGVAVNRNRSEGTMSSWYGSRASQTGEDVGYGDSGGASRFMYVAKSSRSEREVGLRGKLPCLICGKLDSRTHPAPTDDDPERCAECRRNPHPTVKPIDLMRWEARMVTPPGGLVLDLFTGSGSTGCAAVLEGFDFVGIEREDGSIDPETGKERERYVHLANHRIAWWETHRGREADAVLADTKRSERKVARSEDSGQLGFELA